MTTLLRFTLDLFGFEPAPHRPRRTTPKPKVLNPNRPPAQLVPLLPAIENIAKKRPSVDNWPPQTLQESLPEAAIRHPRATREAVLNRVRVAYEFKRGQRRTIGFSVGPDGLAVRAPKWVPLAEIDKAVLEKSAWILKKLQEMRTRSDRLEASRIEWADGCTVPFMGQQVVVQLDPRHAFCGVGAELKNTLPGEAAPGLPGRVLYVGLPHSATPTQIRDAVQAWLMLQAKRVFTEQLDHFAPSVGVKWRKLSLSSAGTRWGSASTDGSIRLNWRLIHFKLSVIDYVVVHELSHLRIMDHSPEFWDAVREVVPNYLLLRGQLKEEAIPRW